MQLLQLLHYYSYWKQSRANRLKQYFQELYSRVNIVIDAAVENTTNLPLTAELDIPHSVEELGKSIDSLAGSKAPGNDDIQPEVIRTAKETVLLEHLYQLARDCAQGDMRHQHHHSI